MKEKQFISGCISQQAGKVGIVPFVKVVSSLILQRWEHQPLCGKMFVFVHWFLIKIKSKHNKKTI